MMLKKLWIIPCLVVLTLGIACGNSPDSSVEPERFEEPIYIGTGVYFNNVELTSTELSHLEGIIGYVPPGRYWIDSQGYFGIEGQRAVGNLYNYIRPTNNTRPSSDNDWIIGVGGCTIAPDGVIC